MATFQLKESKDVIQQKSEMSEHKQPYSQIKGSRNRWYIDELYTK